MSATATPTGGVTRVQIFLGIGSAVVASSFFGSPDYRDFDPNALDVGVLLFDQDLGRTPVPLLVSRDFQAEAVECTNCRHLDTRMVKTCAICSRETRHLSDVSDALVDMAVRNGADIKFIDDDPDLERAGRIGALLRFRADQNTPQKIAV